MDLDIGDFWHGKRGQLDVAWKDWILNFDSAFKPQFVCHFSYVHSKSRDNRFRSNTARHFDQYLNWISRKRCIHTLNFVAEGVSSGPRHFHMVTATEELLPADLWLFRQSLMAWRRWDRPRGADRDVLIERWRGARAGPGYFFNRPHKNVFEPLLSGLRCPGRAGGCTRRRCRFG